MISSDMVNEAAGHAEDFLKKFFEKAGRDIKCESTWDEEGNSLIIAVSGENISDFIGKNGRVIDSLQYITSLAVNKKIEDFVRILIDIDGYREKRKQDLIRLALDTAERVKGEGVSVSLDPMNPYERRIIHMALQTDPDIKTESRGIEPERFLVIMPAEE